LFFSAMAFAFSSRAFFAAAWVSSRSLKFAPLKLLPPLGPPPGNAIATPFPYPDPLVRGRRAGVGCHSSLTFKQDGNPELVIQEAAKLPRPAGMFQLAQGLGLDLADPFTRDRELLAHFLQRVVGVHADPETHAQHALLARGER